MKRFVFLVFCVLLVGWFSNISHGGIFTKFGKKESTRVERQTVGNQILANSGDTNLVEPEGNATRKASEIFPNGVHLEAPEGHNMVVIRFLFELDPTAVVAVKVSVQYRGAKSDSSNGRLIFVYAEKVDKQEVIGDQNDLAKDFSTTEFFLADPASRFINSDGLMEIHIVVSNGQTLDVGTVSVESLQEKPAEIRTRKVVEYQYYPVDYRQDDIFYYYYVGPRYAYYGSTVVVYRDWWMLDSYMTWRANCGYRYTRPVHEIYYLTSPVIYREAHYVPANHYDSGYMAPRLAKVSERQEMIRQSRASERIRSVEGKGNGRTRFDRQGKGNGGDAVKPDISTHISKKDLLQDKSDRRKDEVNENRQMKGMKAKFVPSSLMNQNKSDGQVKTPGVFTKTWRGVKKGAKQAGGAVYNTTKDSIIIGTNHGSYRGNPVGNPAPSRGSSSTDVSQKHRPTNEQVRTQPANEPQQQQSQRVERTTVSVQAQAEKHSAAVERSSLTTKDDDKDKENKPSSESRKTIRRK